MYISSSTSTAEQFQANYRAFYSNNNNPNAHDKDPLNTLRAGSKSMSLDDAMRIFDESLTQRYQKLGDKLDLYKANFGGEKESLNSAASTILGFIENRILRDIAEGASIDELENRLDEGLKGFQQGFAEAKEILNALGSLNSDVQSLIDQTYDQVINGIDAMREKYVDNRTEPASEPDTTVTNPTAATPYAASVSGSYQYQLDRSFSFEVNTADGDTVRINAASAFSFGQAYSETTGSATFSEDGNEQTVGVSLQSSILQNSSSRSFSLEIEGELDDDELEAINDLLNDVNALADDFFAGDLDAAFNQALELSYDTSEITGYALNLSQVETQVATATYAALGPADNNAPLSQSLSPIGDFLNNLISAGEKASRFGAEMDLLLQLANGISELREQSEEETQRFNDFLGAVTPEVLS